MQVIAIGTPRSPGWRWRIVNYAGETVEQSSQEFSTIAAAVAAGSLRLRDLDITDVSVRAYPRRSTSHLRNR